VGLAPDTSILVVQAFGIGNRSAFPEDIDASNWPLRYWTAMNDVLGSIATVFSPPGWSARVALSYGSTGTNVVVNVGELPR
jgi:hypothetical protein